MVLVDLGDLATKMSIFVHFPATSCRSKKEKKEKVTHVARYRRECELASLMLITVFCDAA